MSKFDVIVALRDFIKQIVELFKTDHIVNNYNILLSKIDETKTKAIDVQHKSVTAFLEMNREVLLIQPLALNDYKIKWSPLTRHGSTFDVDLMPAFSKASEKQCLVLHCHLLKLANLVFGDQEFDVLLQDIKGNVPEFEDYEKDIVKKLFKSVREIDVNQFSKEEPEKFVDSIMQSKMSQILPMLRKPNIRWKKLFEYMFQEIEDIGKEHGVSDPVVDDLLQTLKASDYEMTTVIPKLFGIVRHLNLTKYMGGFSTEEQNLMSFHLDQQRAVEGDTVDDAAAAVDSQTKSNSSSLVDSLNHLQLE
jgi:hypothetical protein